MNIHLFNPQIKLCYIGPVVRQMLSGRIGPGKAVHKFEGKLAEVMGLNHAVAVNSGTTGLMLAMKALQLLPGSTVAVPAYGFPAAANAARLLGYQVKLIDIEPVLMCMSPEALSECDAKVACVVYVDQNGHCLSSRYGVRDICKNSGIPLIEDACTALGNEKAGDIGIISVLSFSVPKIVTTGQGGACLTDDENLAQRIRNLSDQGGGWRATRLHVGIGGNFRMTDIQAAYGLAQLVRLPALLRKRERIRGWYNEKLSASIGYSWWCPFVITGEPERLELYLASRGIDSSRLYRAMHEHGPYWEPPGTYPNAERIADSILYLPGHLKLRRKDVMRIAEAVNEYWEISR